MVMALQYMEDGGTTELTRDIEAELYDNPLFSCEGCRSLDPDQDPDTCVVESCPQWKGVRWLKRVRDFIGNLHNDVAELTAVVGDLKAEIDQTTQTYEGMVEVRELVIANHLKRLKSISEVAPYILNVFKHLKAEYPSGHSDFETEEKAIKALTWFIPIEEKKPK